MPWKGNKYAVFRLDICVPFLVVVHCGRQSLMFCISHLYNMINKITRYTFYVYICIHVIRLCNVGTA